MVLAGVFITQECGTWSAARYNMVSAGAIITQEYGTC